MKKVVATTMATLLFGLSFPVNTFALPDNEVSANSQVLAKVSLPNSGDGSQSGADVDNKAKEDTIAKKIEGKLEAKDITVWEEDKVNWKDGIKLKEQKDEFQNYLKDAVVTDLDNRNTSAGSEKNWKGRLKVKFSDNSEVILNDQNLLVINKVTSSDNINAPKDAIKTNFFLGEGVKVSLDKEEKIGNKENPVPYRTYKVKPGTDVSEYKLLATKKNIFDTISAKPINDNYTDVKWQPKNGKVGEDNKSFTATASKLFTMTFKFVGYDRNSKTDISSDKLPKAIKDKLPQEQKIKEGESFNPDKFEDTINENSGENKYEWKFNGWNPTGPLSINENKNFEGTWTRSKVEENSNPEVKPDPGKEEDKKESPENKNKPKDNSKVEDNKNNNKSNNTFPRIKANENKSSSNKVYTRTTKKESKTESKKETFSKTAKYTLTLNSGEYEVLINGQVIKRQMDVKPLIKNDRLMLPLRSLAEMIGTKVEWDQETRTAIFTNKDMVAKIQIDGNEIVLSNGKVIKMDSKPLNIKGRILLPVSNVANVFGLTNGNTKDGVDHNIEWDGDTKTVEINLNK